jgi:hypothetical protein
MKHIVPFLFAVTLVVATTASAQPHVLHRVAAFNNAGLVNMGVELSIPEDTAYNHTLPQKNLVRFGGLYYHVFGQLVGDADVYLHTSVDGITWSAAVQVNDDVANSAQVAPNLVVYDDNGATMVVVSWDDRRSGHAQFTTATSSDGGTTFGPSVELSAHPSSLYCYGNVTVDEAGKLYAVWYKDDGGSIQGTWFSSSDDNGGTWSPMVQIGTPGQFSEPCHVIAHGTDSVLAFYAADQFNLKNIIALSSSDGGVSFTLTQVSAFSGFQKIAEYQSSLVDADGTVHLVFTYGETSGTITNIYYTSSTDWGITWSTPVAVNDVEELFFPWLYQSGQAPSIASPRAGTIYIGWADQRAGVGNWDVYLTRSVDNGATWDTDLMVNDLPATLGQNSVTIAVEPTGTTTENVWVMWTDDRVVIGAGLPDAVEGSGARLFPMPTSNTVTLQLPAAERTGLLLVLCDARGVEVSRQRTTGALTTMDLSSYATGFYHVRIPELGIAMPLVKDEQAFR